MSLQSKLACLQCADPAVSHSALHNPAVNQSIQFYIALLYIPEVALQSPESSSHTHTVIPVVVSYPGADWGRLTEAWLPISANGPSDHHQHSFIFTQCNACLLSLRHITSCSYANYHLH